MAAPEGRGLRGWDSTRFASTDARRRTRCVVLDTRHWYVTLTLSGEPVEPLILRAALVRLNEAHPLFDSIRFAPDVVELSFWEQGESMLDVGSVALRLWNEHRDTAQLPRWQVVGLEVVESALHESRRAGEGPSGLQSLTRLPL